MAEENQQQQPADEPIHHQGGGGGPKTNWPELVGSSVEEAQKKIKEDMAMVEFQVVPPDHFVTMDFIQRRVRLYLDSSGKIARTPQIG
ncbi:Proteinase inhibitor I13 [Macleaya cordata]|uniref:Proteinase inhibitor I13 n=1 Tax=Macleaya cordata TaxID=56857 RepID=A0A200R541_MACCD|nr:Proteinase inhibitor I13 [Macleaya cordata]